MSKKVTTPYGEFKSMTEAAVEITHWHAPEFFKKFGDFTYNYTASLDKNTGNNSARHYIWNVMNDHLLDKVDGWKTV